MIVGGAYTLLLGLFLHYLVPPVFNAPPEFLRPPRDYETFIYSFIRFLIHSFSANVRAVFLGRLGRSE